MAFAVVAIIVSSIMLLVAVFLVGHSVGDATAARRILREMGINKQSAKLLIRAANFINRLVRGAELDGVMGADILSAEKTKEGNEWLTAYRKSLE